ncbi:hypothetical protein PTI98_010502 [Pleurotus ostreatus]|nr:hypothetical protein PTI98_010502 [Pleurotus ostreatus]
MTSPVQFLFPAHDDKAPTQTAISEGYVLITENGVTRSGFYTEFSWNDVDALANLFSSISTETNAATFISAKKIYKPAARRVKPVATTLPEEFRIVRKEPPNILDDFRPPPKNPPRFEPGSRYTQERHDKQNIDPEGWLWPDEVNLIHHIIRANEMAFAWDESEKGALKDEYLPPPY